MSLVPPLPVSGRPLPTKVVVRLLPPTIEESQVLGRFDSYKSTEWFKFCAGSRPDRPSPDNPTVNSRMYIQFKSFQAACDFINNFHGTIFQDDKGDSFRAVAAFAPYQRVSKVGRQLPNALDGSFEDSDHYKSFIEKGPEKFNQAQFTGITKKSTVAPLVAALAERNARLNDEIEKRRAFKKSTPKSSAAAPQAKSKGGPRAKEPNKKGATKPGPPPPPPPPLSSTKSEGKKKPQARPPPASNSEGQKRPHVLKRAAPAPPQ
jgi:hypothetical protein